MQQGSPLALACKHDTGLMSASRMVMQAFGHWWDAAWCCI